MAVIKELIESAGANDSGEGVTVTRGFHVTGLTGNVESRAVDALLQPGIPKLGAPHPAIGFVYVLNRTVKMVEPTQARIEVEYGIPKAASGDVPPGAGGGVDGTAPGINEDSDQGTISVGSSTTTQTTFRDRLGKLMTVGHIVEVEKKVTDPVTGIVSKQTVKEPDVQLREAELISPQTILRVSRVESGSPDIKSRKFVGTVNSRSLGLKKSGRGNDGPRTWLCTRIDGTSNDGGETYNVTYEFQYNPFEWGFSAEWIDPKTGQPAFTDLTGEESKFYQIYPEKDFYELGIRFEGDTSK